MRKLRLSALRNLPKVAQGVTKPPCDLPDPRKTAPDPVFLAHNLWLNTHTTHTHTQRLPNLAFTIMTYLLHHKSKQHGLFSN